MKLSESLANVGPSLAYHPKLCPVVGGVKACVFLCAVVWKSFREHDGWLQMSMEELSKETGMSEKEQRSARIALKSRGILQEREDRLRHLMFYRIDCDALDEAVTSGTDETESPELPKGSFGELPSGSSTDIGKRPRKDPKKISTFPLPESFSTPALEEAWADWQQHRREKRNPITPTAATEQIKKLVAMGADRAVAALRHSIAGGWAGIFEPKPDFAAPRPPSRPVRGPAAAPQATAPAVAGGPVTEDEWKAHYLAAMERGYVEMPESQVGAAAGGYWAAVHEREDRKKAAMAVK